MPLARVTIFFDMVILQRHGNSRACYYTSLDQTYHERVPRWDWISHCRIILTPMAMNDAVCHVLPRYVIF